MRGRNTKGMVGLLLLLLFVPGFVECSPTVTDWDNARCARAGGPFLCQTLDGSLLSLDNTGLTHSRAVTVPAEFHKHPVTFAGTPIPVDSTKSLPSVPAALLLVLSGFVCVSLVRYSRVSLKTLTCVLWAGKTGISLLPRLALCVSCGECTNQRPYGWVAIVTRLLLEISTVSRLASGTEYVALLAKVLVRTNLARGPPSIGRICPSSLCRGLMRKILSSLLGIGTLLSQA